MLFTREFIENVNQELLASIPLDVPCSRQTSNQINGQLYEAKQLWQNTVDTLLHPVYHLHRLTQLAKQITHFYSPCSLKFEHKNKTYSTTFHVTPAMISKVIIKDVRKYRDYDDEGGTYIREMIYPSDVNVILDFKVITDELVHWLGDDAAAAIADNETHISASVSEYISDQSHDWEADDIKDGTHVPVAILLDPVFDIDAITINQAKELAPLWDPNYSPR